jgi:16S rRNA C1402 (ribose-2'-O) methylase RsmI
MLQVLGDRVLALGRELTKAHESLAVRPISQHLASGLEERGEFTLIIQPTNRQPKEVERPTAQVIAQEFGQLTESMAMSRREAIRTVAKRHGISSREVFDLLEESK